MIRHNGLYVFWHLVFESLAYLAAFRLYVWQRQRSGDFLETGTRWTVIVAAIAGAAFGSKFLYWLEDPVRTAHEWSNPEYLLAGKTIVGALLGGTIAVELVKKRSGIRRRTGDLFALPLAIGIAIGRIGCFLAGTEDGTYGNPTGLPWGVDLGDGVRRHPVQLYEIAAMLMLAIFLRRVHPPRYAEGDSIPGVCAGLLFLAAAGGFPEAGLSLRRHDDSAVGLRLRGSLVLARSLANDAELGEAEGGTGACPIR
jgi:prolipoprotein diacylglyceryltransferase